MMSDGLPRGSDFRSGGGESRTPLPRIHRIQDPAAALNWKRHSERPQEKNKMTLFGSMRSERAAASSEPLGMIDLV
jgi:hypothetical protein